jgi:anti-sigma-K factor RskA
MDENGLNMGVQGDTYDLDELLGAYALDAVDGDERRRVEDYLEINPRAAAEVREHREVATMLAFTGMDAPADLWSKITAEIEADAPAPGPELAKVFARDTPAIEATRPGTDAPTGDSSVVQLEDRRTRRRMGTWALGAAAAIALAVAGAVVVIGAGDATSNDPIADAYEQALDDRDSVQTELVVDGSSNSALGVIDQDGHGYLDAGDLPRLAAGQTYQLWGVLAENGDVVSLGILGRNPELETFTIEGDVAALAVTIEQAPGVISDGNPDGAFVGALS